MGFSYGSCMVRVGGLLYWRAVVPERLQVAVGRKEIRRSLRTPYAREARVKVGYLNAKLAGAWKLMDGDSGNLESRFDEILRVKLGQWMIESCVRHVQQIFHGMMGNLKHLATENGPTQSSSEVARCVFH